MLHFGGESDQVRRGQAAEAILNLVQMLDQRDPADVGYCPEAPGRPRAPAGSTRRPFRRRARALERLLVSRHAFILMAITMCG